MKLFRFLFINSLLLLLILGSCNIDKPKYLQGHKLERRIGNEVKVIRVFEKNEIKKHKDILSVEKSLNPINDQESFAEKADGHAFASLEKGDYILQSKKGIDFSNKKIACNQDEIIKSHQTSKFGKKFFSKKKGTPKNNPDKFWSKMFILFACLSFYTFVCPIIFGIIAYRFYKKSKSYIPNNNSKPQPIPEKAKIPKAKIPKAKKIKPVKIKLKLNPYALFSFLSAILWIFVSFILLMILFEFGLTLEVILIWIAFCLFFFILSVILGRIALKKIASNPGKYRGKRLVKLGWLINLIAFLYAALSILVWLALYGSIGL